MTKKQKKGDFPLFVATNKGIKRYIQQPSIYPFMAVVFEKEGKIMRGRVIFTPQPLLGEEARRATKKLLEGFLKVLEDMQTYDQKTKENN